MTLQASPAWAADPGPSNILPGQDTATPVLVEGIRESVDAKAAPADAARGHLAANKSRYKIPRAGSDLVPLSATATGSKDETVRLQQKHRGVEVLGGQYVVRMQKQDGKRVVTGTSGHYFTALNTDVTPQVTEDVAVRRAVAATARRLGADLDKGQAPRSESGDPAATGMTGEAKGLVVLPKGGGVLAYRVTVRGTAPGTGAPVVDEVYVDARSGYPALQYSALKTLA
ncbi:M4 family peptidase, partial [Streptomyces virginiae]